MDKTVGVRDLRSNHRGQMVHMYSMLVLKSRVSSSSLPITGNTGSSINSSALSFLPSHEDIVLIRKNLVVLVICVLCTYIKSLKPLNSVIPKHIIHQFSTEMSQKSDVHVLDVLMKNETCHSDTVDIMHRYQSFLADSFPEGHRVLSGGDLLTCERQTGAQRHLMDGDTNSRRLAYTDDIPIGEH